MKNIIKSSKKWIFAVIVGVAFAAIVAFNINTNMSNGYEACMVLANQKALANVKPPIPPSGWCQVGNFVCEIIIDNEGKWWIYYEIK